jgi:hypothetical protein
LFPNKGNYQRGFSNGFFFAQVQTLFVRWLLLFVENDFIVVYKLGRTHVIIDALSTTVLSRGLAAKGWVVRPLKQTSLFFLGRPTNIIEPTSVFNQTIDASLFYTKPEWLKDVKEFLKIKQIGGMLLVQQRLVKRAEPFTLKNGGLYRMGQNN